jgi:excisionase family DNA binding protein
VCIPGAVLRSRPTHDEATATRATGNGSTTRRALPLLILEVVNVVRVRDELLTEEQLADLLSISDRTPAGWRLRGEGPPWHKVGALVRYRRSDVDRWLAAQRREPRPV